jgi:hypothetical protein
LPSTLTNFPLKKRILKVVEIINLQMGKYLATTMRAETFNKYDKKEKTVNQKLLEQRELLLERPPHFFVSKRKITVALSQLF